jgi:hypothetical protein
MAPKAHTLALAEQAGRPRQSLAAVGALRDRLGSGADEEVLPAMAAHGGSR